MARPESEPVPWRIQIAVYGIGLFSTTMFFLASVVLPLWVVRLEASPLMIGVVLGARQFLPLFFSIHAGALLDRLGPRRVLTFFALIGLAVPLLFPLLPWVAAALVLQLLAGMADSIGWLGAQTMIGKLMHGRTRYAGRLSFIIRFGHLAGPPLIGAVWDLFGPWAAFGMMGAWGTGTLVCALMLPRTGPSPSGAGDLQPAAGRRAGLAAVMPRPSDYLAAFRMLSVPVIAAGVVIGMLIHLGNSLQASFYVVYLGQIGLPGTMIGLLFSTFAVCAAAGSLVAARLTRLVPSLWLLIAAVTVTSLMITITPLLGAFAVLVAVMAVRGISNGIHQPLIITTVLRGADAANQGKAMGIRGTANRLASVTSPLLVGAVGEVAGIEAGFYAVGCVIAALLAALVLFVLRHPEIWHGRRPETSPESG